MTRPAGLLPGSRELQRLEAGMLAAALAAFSLLYFTQALLPALDEAFGVGPALSALTVSVATGGLAVSIVPLSSLAESYGRVRVMRIGLVTACALAVLCAAAPSFWLLLVLRGLIGVALAGVVAVAVGHLGDELHPAAVSTAIGLYVSGNTLGGVIGRLVPGAALTFGSWRVAVLLAAACACAAVAVFLVGLPPARRFEAVPPRLSAHVAALRGLWQDRGIRRLCLLAFLMMGGFVACYNYLTFRLTGPLQVSDSAASLLFLAYLAGTVSSPVAASLAGRVGRRRVVCASGGVALAGLALTLVDQVAVIMVGLVVFTAGFFGAHGTASGWVPALAAANRAQAAGLYLTAYYLGSSVFGALLGVPYQHGGWPWCAAAIAVLFAAAVAAVRGAGAAPAPGPASPSPGG